APFPPAAEALQWPHGPCGCASTGVGRALRGDAINILLVTPMPADPDGAGAIPLLLDALVTGLARRHSLTIATIAGPDPAELAAVERRRFTGIDVHAAERVEPVGLARW